MLHRLVMVLCVSSLLLSSVGVASAIPYYLTDLGPTGSDGITIGWGISLVNGSPEMVGKGLTSDAPYTWTAQGTPTNLSGSIPGTMPTTNQTEYAHLSIDSDGDIAGATMIGGVPYAYYLPSGGTATVLPALDPNNLGSVAFGVNSAGTVVGYSS